VGDCGLDFEPQEAQEDPNVERREAVASDAKYLGKFPRALDSKSRVQLPATWKKDLPEDLVLVPYIAHEGLHSVRVYSNEGFAEFITSIFGSEGGFDANNRDHVDRRAAYTMDSYPVQQDGAGRILIPVELRTFAGLDKDLVAAGEWDFISLWNQDTHSCYRELAGSKTLF
jgi:MraZ protein